MYLHLHPVSTKKPELSPKTFRKSTVSPENVEKSVENVEKPRQVPVENSRTPPSAPLPPQEKLTMPPPPPAPAEPVPPVPEAPREELPWRLAGEVLQTYLIVERGEEILFIDKHAAHERMNFDRMKQEGYQPMAQTLLAPVIFTPSPEEGAVLLEHQDLLSRFGFACGDFGGTAV